MENISITDSKTFVTNFLKKYLENGLGTMSKREMDILVTNLLMEFGYSDELVTKTNKNGMLTFLGNNELSILLQLTESRIKSLRYEARLKYPPDEDYIRREFLNSLYSSRYVYAASSEDPFSGKISFVMEDVYLRQAIYGKLKKDGMFADTSFNNEIVKINPSYLIEVIEKLFDKKTAEAFRDGLEFSYQDGDKNDPNIMQEVVKRFVLGMAKTAGTAVGGAAYKAIAAHYGWGI